MALQAITLPADVRKYLHKATRGEMEVGVRGLQDGMRLIYKAIRQGIYATLAIASGYAALQLRMTGDHALAKWCAGGAAAMLVVLFFSLLTTRTSLRR
jgi:hypothetical protein